MGGHPTRRNCLGDAGDRPVDGGQAGCAAALWLTIFLRFTGKSQGPIQGPLPIFFEHCIRSKYHSVLYLNSEVEFTTPSCLQPTHWFH
jgi:hypothetical protein